MTFSSPCTNFIWDEYGPELKTKILKVLEEKKMEEYSYDLGQKNIFLGNTVLTLSKFKTHPKIPLRKWNRKL